MSENLSEFYKPNPPLEFDNSVITILAPYAAALLREASIPGSDHEAIECRFRAGRVVHLYHLHCENPKNRELIADIAEALREWSKHGVALSESR